MKIPKPVSMTAFGRGQADAADLRVAVEIRSLNARFLDVIVRLPQVDVVLEEEIRRRVRGTVARGRVEVFVNVEGRSPVKHMNIDRVLAASYHKCLKEVAEDLGIDSEPALDTLARMPGVFSFEEGGGASAAAPTEAVMEALEGALAAMLEMRTLEGRAMAEDMNRRLVHLDTIAAEMESRVPTVSREYQRRLRERLSALLEDGRVDEARLASELAIMVERADITEELVRLRSHGSQMAEILAHHPPAGEGIGRRFDFLCQEMNRELNTIASKAGDLEVARSVVAARGEVEKLREQAQNLE